jgi:uncharacterized phage protein gp47/JayE
MPGPYPLPSLAAQVTPTGITAPSFEDILLSLIATMQSIFGSDIYLGPDSQDYQMLAAFAMAINDQNQTLIAVYNGFLPSFAQGAELSALVKINGLQRIPGTASTAQLTITGVVGTTIVDGVVQDANGNLWDLPASVVIPLSGSIVVTATCETVGAIAAASNTITKIVTVVAGWQSVTNLASATQGVATESDAALRQRQAQSTALPSQTPLQAILAAVANVSGVTRYAAYENDTGTPDSNGVPGHSISVVVQGGSVAAVALAIEEKKAPGTGTYGTTSQTVSDPAGLPITINFYELVDVSIYVSLTIKALPGYVSTTGAAIIAAIVAFINGLAIGQEVFYNWIWGPASLAGTPLETTFRITALTIGTSPSPVGTADLPIPFNEAASSATANVVLTVT